VEELIQESGGRTCYLTPGSVPPPLCPSPSATAEEGFRPRRGPLCIRDL